MSLSWCFWSGGRSDSDFAASTENRESKLAEAVRIQDVIFENDLSLDIFSLWLKEEYEAWMTKSFNSFNSCAIEKEVLGALRVNN